MKSKIRLRALGVVTAAAAVLAVPAAAGAATTLTGAGSSAAQPYMLELFKGYSKIHHNIRFRYVPDGGNAGVKDVQAGRAEFSINTRPPNSRPKIRTRECSPRGPLRMNSRGHGWVT